MPPIQLPASALSRRSTNNSSSSYPPALSDELRTTILNSLVAHNGIQPIRATLEQQLAAAGWMDALRHNISAIIRRGDGGTYEQIMRTVLDSVKNSASDEPVDEKKPTSSVGGGVDGDEVQSLKLPEQVVAETVAVIKRELEKICEVALDS